MAIFTYRAFIIGILCLFTFHTTVAIQQPGTGLPDDIPVTLRFTNVEIAEILNSIQQQTGFIFFYSNNLLNNKERRTIKVSKVPLEQALALLLDNKKFSWIIDRKHKSVRIVSREVQRLSPAIATSDSVATSTITGQVTDKSGTPLIGATLRIAGTGIGTLSDADGKFVLRQVPSNVLLQVTFTGFQRQELLITGSQQDLQIDLAPSPSELGQVEVLSTGYQQLPKERATGSFDYLDHQLLNRSVSTDILSRLEGVSSGVLFNKAANRVGFPGNGGDPAISIRGRSTLFANTAPLVILDNFPYDGDLSNINPNDIASVTVLKDAAAASIWGVRAGNGVIVLTSKMGQRNQKPVISFNTNVTVACKPDVYAIPQLTTKAYMDLEKFWFDNGKYDIPLSYMPYQQQSPVIDILDNEKKGRISHADAAQQLNALSSIDTRSDYSKYFLRKAIYQQYALNMSGGSQNDQYYLSGGFDRNLYSAVPDNYNRFTLNAKNTYKLLQERLELTSDLFFTKSLTRSHPARYSPLYPYEKVVDSKGNALPVIRDFRQASKDELSNSDYLDWNYYPFNERLNNNNKTDLSDYRINIGLQYKIIPALLSLHINYQYQQGNTDQDILMDQSSYSTRLLINEFTQIDPAGNITYPVPLGAIFTNNKANYKSNTGRAQLNYNQTFSAKHQVTAIGGFEIKDYNSSTSLTTLYGYNPDNATNIPVDYFTYFTRQFDGNPDRIPNMDRQGGTSDRFLSYYINAAYTYDYKYSFYVSARRDESNLFGVNTNQKGVPLYSAGVSWLISREKFYHLDAIPYLKIRVTDGYNGNLSKNLSAYTTARADGLNNYGVPQQVIINPSNPDLSWEKVHIINAGVDFGAKGNRLNGSVDFFSKKGENLIGNSPVAPQTGNTQFTGNTADMLTKGIDLTLNSINIKGAFTWTTNVLFSYARDKITDYKLQTGINNNYVQSNYMNPIVGRPYSAIFAYAWAGLDNMGNPQGIVDGKISEDYGAILNATNREGLVYKGPANPSFFGGIRNNFSYKGAELSFNITYKMGYYFRRGSFNATNGSYQQADYDKRWQHPGDEKITIVPSLIYPADDQRDAFYNGAEVLVEKGDQIRLQDIQAAYTLQRKNNRLPFSSIKIYGYVNNLGILWRANKLKLDPDFVGNGGYTMPTPSSYSFGATVNF